MEKKLIDAIQLNYHQIAEKYAQHVSAGNKKLNIKDAAILQLYGAKGVVTDIEFQQYISDALSDPQFKFSSQSVPLVKKLIETMKTDQFSDKHPLVKMLKDKLPVETTSTVITSAPIHHNVKFQMLAIKEMVQKDTELREMLEKQSLQHALESNPDHLFSMILSMKEPETPELAQKLHELKASCLYGRHYIKK